MKYKRLLALTLTVILVLTTMPFSTFDLMVNAETEELYTYSVSDDKATITFADKSISGDVEIPKTLGGYFVTGISKHAFAYCESLTSITLPDSITTIGVSAFDSCKNLIVKILLV